MIVLNNLAPVMIICADYGSSRHWSKQQPVWDNALRIQTVPPKGAVFFMMQLFSNSVVAVSVRVSALFHVQQAFPTVQQ